MSSCCWNRRGKGQGGTANNYTKQQRAANKSTTPGKSPKTSRQTTVFKKTW